MKTTASQVVDDASVRSLGTILGLWAHPDDETFCSGGLMALAAQSGQRVVCATATYGEAGSQDVARWPVETLADTRKNELALALQKLGVTEHHWLGYADGDCQAIDNAVAAEQLAKLIETINPDTIITFGKEGLTGHPDHQAVCRWTHRAIDMTGCTARVLHPIIAQEQFDKHLRIADEKLNIFFALDVPPIKPICDCAIQLVLPKNVMAKKLAALAVMPSQTEAMFAALGEDTMREAWSIETFTCCSS